MDGSELSKITTTEAPQPAFWSTYIVDRLSKPEPYKASYLARILGRDLTATEQEEYKQAILQAGMDIQQRLGIEDSLFQDKRYAEVFLAISDSWVLNQKRLERFSSEDPTYTTERDFLIHVARSLAGSKSAYNREQAINHSPHAGYYVNVGKLTGISTQEESAAKGEIEKIVKYEDTEGTDALQIFLRGDNNVTRLIKTKLGASFEGLREDWNVLVIASPTDNPNEKWGDQSSLAIAGAFVSTYKDKPTLFITRKTLDKLLEGETRAEETLEHELTHIFRNDSILMGENLMERDRILGGMCNEFAATLVSNEGAGHLDATIFFELLNMTQGPMVPTDRLSGEVNKVLANALRDNTMENFYQYISDNFGLRMFLLLTTYYPTAYYSIFKKQNQSLPFNHSNVPEVRDMLKRYYGVEITQDANLVQKWGDQPELLSRTRGSVQFSHMISMISASLFNTMIQGAIQINPNALHYLEENVHRFGPKYARAVQSFFRLPPAVQRIFQAEAENTDTPS